MTVKLYCFGESGNSYKAALAMELAGIDWEPVWINFFKGAHKEPQRVPKAAKLLKNYLKLTPDHPTMMKMMPQMI